MLILGFTALFLLTALNYYLGRSIFYPAFTFCAVWTIALFCLLVSGDMFFPVSAETISIFMWGAVSFTIGGAVGTIPRITSSPQPREPNKIIGICIFALVLIFPFYLHWLIGLVANNPGEFFLTAARHSLVEIAGEATEKHTLQYALFITLLVLVPIFAVLAWMERKGRMKRALLAVAIAFLYHAFTGARSAMIQLLLSLLCVEWLTFKKLKLKMLAVVCLLTVAIFGSLAILVHGTNAVDELVGYIGGPLVAYGRVVRDPKIVPHNITAATAFLERAHRLGLKIDIPSRQSEFVPTGPDREDNVFTIYFAYSNVGMVIGCILLFWESFLICLIYRSAVKGSKVAIVVYSFLFSYIAMATFTDWILGSLEALIKLACLTATFYYFLPLKARFGRFLRSAAQDHIDEISSQ